MGIFFKRKITLEPQYATLCMPDIQSNLTLVIIDNDFDSVARRSMGIPENFSHENTFFRKSFSRKP